MSESSGWDGVIEEFLKRNMSCKMDKIAAKTFAEYVHLFIIEAIQRAEKDAASDLGAQEIIVDTKHLEHILPQLLVDFC